MCDELYPTLLYSALLYSTILYSAILYSAILCSALFYSIINDEADNTSILSIVTLLIHVFTFAGPSNCFRRSCYTFTHSAAPWHASKVNWFIHRHSRVI